MICMDQQRLSQILLNLISNSLKFTSNGGFVKVKAKVLNYVSELSYPKEQAFVDIVENANHGVVEIIVEDSGIGIKSKDQSKLFKLFGFLETTQQLNTKGIGLGLHICKIIIKQFGGEIICKSKW